jgi:hypothetical protein
VGSAPVPRASQHSLFFRLAVADLGRWQTACATRLAVPGVSYSRGKDNITVRVPWRMRVNRTQSLTERLPGSLPNAGEVAMYVYSAIAPPSRDGQAASSQILYVCSPSVVPP